MDHLLDEFDDLELQELSRYDSSGKDQAPYYSDSEEDKERGSCAPPQAPPSPSKSSEPGDLTCAICLGDIPLENMAMVKGCDHIYCAHCILHWALHKEEPWCPQCKQPFSYLLTYRSLDGELSDFPTEESVVLLKRARWFTDTLRPCELASSLLEDSILADETAWHEYADEYDLAEDEEIEAYYFSSAAGRARILLGNRRFGEGGYIAGGRRQARPVPSAKKVKGKGTVKGKHVRSHAANTPVVEDSSGAGPSSSAAMSAAVRTPNAGGGRPSRQLSPALINSSSPHLSSEFVMGTSPGCGSMVYGSSPSGSGRRARRNARRAAMDCPQSGDASGAFCGSGTAGTSFEGGDASSFGVEAGQENSCPVPVPLPPSGIASGASR